MIASHFFIYLSLLTNQLLRYRRAMPPILVAPGEVAPDRFAHLGLLDCVISSFYGAIKSSRTKL